MSFQRLILLFFLFFLLTENVYSCGPETIEREPIEEISIFCPENLTSLIKEMRGIFEKNYPGHTIYAAEASDLENIYDILHFNKTPDVLILSDDSLVEKFLSSYVGWYIIFAYDRVILAFSEESKYSSKIGENNWYKIIAQKDVILARMNEKMSPLGYRTIMVLNLAQDYYQQDFNDLFQNFSPQNIFSTQKELNLLLLSADLDYTFNYLSSAEKYKFRYITFPAQIDLSFRYIITIPNNVAYPERGMKFLKVMFSRQGQEILKRFKVQVMKPSLIIINKSSKIPEGIEKFLEVGL